MHKSFMGWERADTIIREMFLADCSDDEMAIRIGIPEGSIRHRRYILDLRREKQRRGKLFKSRVISMYTKGMKNTEIAEVLNVHVGQISQVTAQIGFLNIHNDMVEEVRFENGVKIEKIKAAHAYGSEPAYNRAYR